MKVLIVCARFPELGRKGDQVRALQIARLLAPQHAVTLATAARPSSAAGLEAVENLASLVTGRVRGFERTWGALVAGLHGMPLQVGWMMPPRWFRHISRIAYDYDVVVVVTIRCLPGPLPIPTVLDHVDALSWNMRQRARLERRFALKLAARLEAWLMGRHERRAARWVMSQAVVSPIDAASLPQSPPPVVMPLTLELPEVEVSKTRDIDVILTGDMRYPPNRDAAEWLADAIAPKLQARRPDVRIMVAGRSAHLLALRPGIEVLSDVPDLWALLRRSRVAVVPLRRGTGTPNKVLEAAACGAAIVGTPWVAQALDIDIDIAPDADSFAAAIDLLLRNEPLRTARVDAAREGFQNRSPDAVTPILERLIAPDSTS